MGQGVLTRMEGLAILGGTRPESCRRTREACIDLGSQLQFLAEEVAVCALLCVVGRRLLFSSGTRR